MTMYLINCGYIFQNISLQKICRLLICLTHFVSCRPSCIAAHFLSSWCCCAARKSESRSRCDCGWHSLASSPSRKRQFLFTFFILFLPLPNEISWAKIHNNVGLFCCPGVYATTPRLVSWKCWRIFRAGQAAYMERLSREYGDYSRPNQTKPNHAHCAISTKFQI